MTQTHNHEGSESYTGMMGLKRSGVVQTESDGIILIDDHTDCI